MKPEFTVVFEEANGKPSSVLINDAKTPQEAESLAWDLIPATLSPLRLVQVLRSTGKQYQNGEFEGDLYDPV